MFTNVCRASSWLLRGPVPGCGARPLPEVASLAAEHRQDGLRASLAIACRLTSCGTQAQLLRSRWGLPGSGIEPLSLELAGRFFTTELPAFVLKSVVGLCGRR